MRAHRWRVDEAFAREQRKAALAGELVGGFTGAAMDCTMRLQRLDPLYWPRAEIGEALYLHKLAVRREAAGQGWPADLVKFALFEAASRGRTELRLDTTEDGPLPSLYRALGFEAAGPAPDAAGIVLMRMQVPGAGS